MTIWIFEIVNTAITIFGVATFIFILLAVGTTIDYLEIGVVSLCIGWLFGLCNLMYLSEVLKKEENKHGK